MNDQVNCPDEVKDENIVTLINDDGEKVDFYEVAFIALGDKSYSILQPVVKMEDLGEDEALVFEVVYEDESEYFEFVEDDEIVDSVFAEYERLLKEDE